MNKMTKDLTGERHGKLVVESRLPNKDNRRVWRCRCDCGETRDMSTVAWRNEGYESCLHCAGDVPGAPLAVRLRRYVVRPNGCWEWTGRRIPGGYGGLIEAGKPVLAHRMMFFQRHPDADKSLCVLHRCDNPPCINPDHLFLGTRLDNMNDMVSKGRDRFWGNAASPPRRLPIPPYYGPPGCEFVVLRIDGIGRALRGTA